MVILNPDFLKPDDDSNSKSLRFTSSDNHFKETTIQINLKPLVPPPVVSPPSPPAPAPVVVEVPDNVIQLGGCRVQDSDNLELLAVENTGPIEGERNGKTLSQINFRDYNFKSTDLIAYMELQRGTSIYEYLCFNTKPPDNGTYTCESFSRDSDENFELKFKLTYDDGQMNLNVNSSINTQKNDKIIFRYICVNINDIKIKAINNDTELHIRYNNESSKEGEIVDHTTNYKHVGGTCLFVGGINGIVIRIK